MLMLFIKLLSETIDEQNGIKKLNLKDHKVDYKFRRLGISKQFSTSFHITSGLLRHTLESLL